MNIKQELVKISKTLNAGASQSYRQKRQSIDSVLVELKNSILKHETKQKKDPDNYGYVGDLNYVLSQLKEMVGHLGDRE